MNSTTKECVLTSVEDVYRLTERQLLFQNLSGTLKRLLEKEKRSYEDYEELTEHERRTLFINLWVHHVNHSFKRDSKSPYGT